MTAAVSFGRGSVAGARQTDFPRGLVLGICARMGVRAHASEGSRRKANEISRSEAKNVGEFGAPIGHLVPENNRKICVFERFAKTSGVPQIFGTKDSASRFYVSTLTGAT